MGDTLDEVLPRFAACGPEFGQGLSNHGPMAAEALVALGREDAVEGWSAWYAPRLAEQPRAIAPIGPSEWQEALGDVKRAADWSAFFHRELADGDWRGAVRTWTPRLAPGLMAGATHGVRNTSEERLTLLVFMSPNPNY